MLWRLLLWSLLIPLGWGALTITPAYAHSEIVQASPPGGATLVTAPARVDLLFADELDGDKSQLRVLNAAGERVDRRDLQVDGRTMSVGVRVLPAGAYTVRWVATEEDDGHRTRGEYGFYVAAPQPGQPQLTVAPATTDAGQLVTLTGSGFAPSSLAVLGIGDEQRFLGTVQVDSSGAFALQTLVPDYLPHGRQVVQAIDLDQQMATAALRIDRGGWPPVGVQRQAGEGHSHGGEEHAGHLAVQVRLVNRSDWDLFDVDLTGRIPPGTHLVRREVEGPDGVRWTADGSRIRWQNARLRPHQILGPFTYVLDVSALPPGTEPPDPSVTVTFEHREAPLFRGRATAP
jgi:methionine-rich copper-binding protein CopC